MRHTTETVIKLNLARNCLKYIVKAYGIKEIFVPYYSCNTVWKALREENCKLKFYKTDKNFTPILNVPKDTYILYINYFGLCGEICEKLAGIYPNLIIDNTQSFYAKPTGLASFNSLRKFFRVQNGAYLYINKKLNTKFETDDIKIKPVLIHENYNKFVQNELILNNENIKYISSIVNAQMEKIDFNTDKKQRITLFNKYTEIFHEYNQIKLNFTKETIPYCYPLKTENKIIKEKLSKFILLQLWEKNNIIALPLNDFEYAKRIMHSFSCEGTIKAE